MHFVAQTSPFSSPEIAPSGFVLPAILPDDIAALKALLHAQHAAHESAMKAAIAAAVEASASAIKREAQAYVQRMLEQLVLARHRLFGVSSEQGSGQARLFDEAEPTASNIWRAGRMCADALLMPPGCNPKANVARPMRPLR